VRPRLAFLADIVSDLIRAVRLRPSDRGYQGRRPPTSEQDRAAEEVKRRLDETRERLKRETPPRPNGP
jgi:hypothetical protein